MNDNDSPRIAVPPLPVLFRQLNKTLGWRPSDMAHWMGKDNAEISRWLSLKKPHKMHDATLEFIARKYQDAGLEQITVDLLRSSRDYGGRVDSENPFNVPEHWLRLITTVLSFDAEFQDMLYRKWSQDLEFSARLALRGRRRDEID